MMGRIIRVNNLVGMKLMLDIPCSATSRRSKSNISSIFSFDSTGDKNLDTLKQQLYSPLIGEVDIKKIDANERTDASKRSRTARFYSSMINRFSLTMVFEKEVLALKENWLAIDNDIEKLNNLKNLEILHLNNYEKRFVDPNRLMTFYDVIDITDPFLFNSALSRSKEELLQMTIKHSKVVGLSRLRKRSSYIAILLSEAALYLDSTLLFEILNTYKSLYKLYSIRVNKDSLNTGILSAKDELEILSYDNLLSYAKDSHRSDNKEIKNDENYLKLFTRFGELGFVEISKADNCLYLSKK